MAVYNYRKYRISLSSDSKKTQGLRTGDIVRRQYQDGSRLIHSLMCVTECGRERLPESGEEREYFIGALLEGDVPEESQLLDFARVTSLTDTDRSGALYLTGSDAQAPYMDVIDGIGREKSLCWPESMADADYTDPTRQYVVTGERAVEAEYIPSQDGRNRILHLTRNGAAGNIPVGICQDNYQYLASPERVLVGFYAKASAPCTGRLAVGYQDWTKTDGVAETRLSEEWEYHLYAVTIEHSGRHLRSVKADFPELAAGTEIWIADFNVILLSSVSAFTEATKARVGRLDGVNDPVFGTLDGYGGYMQRLFASRSAHVSGTLTAGDENGFASTFYAGKIHRNAFTNSMNIDWVYGAKETDAISNPTGIGKVYELWQTGVMTAQEPAWCEEHAGQKYTFSFWLYAEMACRILFAQNNMTIHNLLVEEPDTRQWKRMSITFEILPPTDGPDYLKLIITPNFLPKREGTARLFFTSPQLEKGTSVTQYQPTGSRMNYTEEYGAWFDRGGIGGTIQDPLLQLNYDGQGSIGSRTKSMMLRPDGSGYLANGNIRWDSSGKITFGNNVTVNWNNLSQDSQDMLEGKHLYITGENLFTLIDDSNREEQYSEPETIELSAQGSMDFDGCKYMWEYATDEGYRAFKGNGFRTLTIRANGAYWTDTNILNIRCVVTQADGRMYIAAHTVRRQKTSGFSIEIVSSQGVVCPNRSCQTILTANVYYQGQLLDAAYVAEHYSVRWVKYHLPDLENPVEGWWEPVLDEDGNVIKEGIDPTLPSISLDYEISGQDRYACMLTDKGEENNAYPYYFPLTF